MYIYCLTENLIDLAVITLENRNIRAHLFGRLGPSIVVVSNGMEWMTSPAFLCFAKKSTRIDHLRNKTKSLGSRVFS